MGVRRVRAGFTLIDVMITVVLIGILAAVVIPIVSGHLDRAQQTAASATQAMVRKALDMYFQRHNDWPPQITPDMFRPAEDVTMPRGYQLVYDPASGTLELVLVPEPDAETAPAVALAE